MFKKLLVVVIVVASVAGLIGIAAALFTDTKSVDANLFTAGTIIISTNPTTAVVTFDKMAPGDEVTVPLTVDNDGNLELRYALTSVATNEDTKALMGQLDLTIKEDVTTCTTAAFDSDGTVVYATNDLGSLDGTHLIGDPATGIDAGDRVLAAGDNEILCINVILPLNTSDAFQGATTTATFTFDAEQTVNNMTVN